MAAVIFKKWESDFFGKKVYICTPGREPDDFEVSRFSCDVCDLDSIKLAEKNGYNLIDTKVTLELRDGLNFKTSESEFKLSRAYISDSEELSRISSTNHKQSMFYIVEIC